MILRKFAWYLRWRIITRVLSWYLRRRGFRVVAEREIQAVEYENKRLRIRVCDLSSFGLQSIKRF